MRSRKQGGSLVNLCVSTNNSLSHAFDGQVRKQEKKLKRHLPLESGKATPLPNVKKGEGEGMMDKERHANCHHGK